MRYERIPVRGGFHFRFFRQAVPGPRFGAPGRPFRHNRLVFAALALALVCAPVTGARGQGALPQDIDANGAVNAIDVQLVINTVLGVTTDHDADINGDGATNAVDVQFVINGALGILEFGASISIQPKEAVIGATGHLYLEADGDGSVEEVRWVSLAPSVAAVDGVGAVEAVSPGTAHIYAVAGPVPSVAEAVITVAPDTLEVSPSPLTLHENAQATLSVTSSAEDDAFSFLPDNALIASVDNFGEVTGMAAGGTVITVSSQQTGLSVELAVSVLPEDVPVPEPGRAVVEMTAPPDLMEPAVKVVLDDGSEFLVHEFEDAQAFNERLSEMSDEWPLDEELLGETPLKSSLEVPATRPLFVRYVNHGAFQTPVRNQQDRNTCSTFATVAALEAAYKRAGYGDLDLSEQQLNHLGKTTWLHPFIDEPRPRGVYENQLGMTAGGGSYAGQLLTRYGLPTESQVPYRFSRGTFGGAWGDYHNLRQPGDVPGIPPDTTRQELTQREINDFNLEHRLATWQIPASYPFIPLDANALRDGQYGVTGFYTCPPERVRDIAWWENVLAMGYEIVFDAMLVFTVEDGVWVPQNESDEVPLRGAHTMCMVGYDRRDPSNRHFIVKNSWGESGFIKLSYEWVTGSVDGRVLAAAVITDIADPAEKRYKAQAALGRWVVETDLYTSPAELDIFRQAQYFDRSFLGGFSDFRLGEFYDPSGAPFKVNGFIFPNLAVWYLNLANPNPNFQQITGNIYYGYFDVENPFLMAGHMVPPGGGARQGFYAHKDGPLEARSPHSAISSDEVFLGRWEIVHHDVPGWLEITGVDVGGGDGIAVTYEAPGGARFSYGGTANHSTRAVEIGLSNHLIDVKGSFSGHILATNPAIIAGNFRPTTGPRNGMVLRRVNYAGIEVNIVAPLNGETFVLGDTIQLGAQTIGDGQTVNAPQEVRWSTGAPFDEGGTLVATGQAGVWTPDAPGTYNLYAVYLEPSVSGPGKRAQAQVTITVQDPQAPAVTITEPEDGARFGMTADPNPVMVTFTGTAVDTIDGALPGSSLQWAYRQAGTDTWLDAGTGSQVTIGLEDLICFAYTEYEVRLQAENSNGLTGADIITVGVNVLFCR